MQPRRHFEKAGVGSTGGDGWKLETPCIEISAELEAGNLDVESEVAESTEGGSKVASST